MALTESDVAAHLDKLPPALRAAIEGLEHENEKLRAAAMDAARERDEALAEVAAHEAEARKHFERAEDEARSLELAKDELATLTVRFDETARELSSMRRFAVEPLRESVLRLGARNRKARAELEDLRGYATPLANVVAGIMNTLDDCPEDIPADTALMRQAAYDLIEREWAELHVTQALRVPSAELAWYVNGFCALDRTLFGAVETWRELQQQKGDKEP